MLKYLETCYFDINSNNDKVPTSRTINGYNLTANRSLTYSDVGALPSDKIIYRDFTTSSITINSKEGYYYSSLPQSGTNSALISGYKPFQINLLDTPTASSYAGQILCSPNVYSTGYFPTPIFFNKYSGALTTTIKIRIWYIKD